MLENGYLYTGDLVYKGRLYANYPSTNPEELMKSIEKISMIPVKRLCPAHYSLDIQPSIIKHMKEEMEKIKFQGKLHHGSGVFDYGEWSLHI